MKLRRRVVLLAVAIAMVPLSLTVRAADAPDGQRWWSHVLVLADDKLEGRGTGSEGHRKAAEYVAKEFEKAGLKPAGTEGYLQPVRLMSRAIDEEHSSLALIRPTGPEPLVLGQDAIISSRIDPAPTVEAPTGVRRIWAANPRGPSRRLRRPGRPRQAGGDPGRGAGVDPGPTGRAHAVGCRASGPLEATGCHRPGEHRQPEEHGHPLGAFVAGAIHAVDEPGRPGHGRDPGPEAGRHDQPGPRPQTVRRLRLTPSARSSTRPMPASPCHTSRSRGRSKRQPP